MDSARNLPRWKIIYVQPQLYIIIIIVNILCIFIFAYLIITYLINFFWLNLKITKDGIINYD